MDVLKIIWNKNEVCNTGFGCTVDDSYNWFYTEKVPYFLEDNNKTDKEIINENSMEYKRFTNVHNLGEKREDYEGKENRFWDHFKWKNSFMADFKNESYHSLISRWSEKMLDINIYKFQSYHSLISRHKNDFTLTLSNIYFNPTIVWFQDGNDE